jgi:hypothetical protein
MTREEKRKLLAKWLGPESSTFAQPFEPFTDVRDWYDVMRKVAKQPFSFRNEWAKWMSLARNVELPGSHEAVSLAYPEVILHFIRQEKWFLATMEAVGLAAKLWEPEGA